MSTVLQTQSRRSALNIAGEEITYKAIDQWSRRIAARLQGQVIGIFAGSSLETYAGVLAVARSGRTYIPLNADFPDDRLLHMIAERNPETLVVDRQHIERVCGLLRHTSHSMRLIVLDPELSAQAASMSRQHTFVLIEDQWTPEPFDIDVDVDDETPLYIMTTSGSTGAPKSIAIPRSNVVDYLKSIRDLFDFQPCDRFSHFFKLSFDLSVHDMFVAWSTGGCLYVPGPKDLLDPVAYAKRNALTVWFSVPSLVSLAIISRKLKADALPDVRHAFFCGEALSWEVIDAFRAAAPQAVIRNLYGPTEATIAITHYTVDKNLPFEQRAKTSVPIGRPFAGQEALVVGSDLSVLPTGERGELLLGGSQLAPGYVNNPTQTGEAFLDRAFPGFVSKRWYRTGDIAMEHKDKFVFLGRLDTQVKFRGHRVELGEIEAVLQHVAKTPLAIVIASPPFGPGPIDRLLAFVMPPHNAIQEVHAMMRDRLPAHMVPARILSIDQPMDMILNDNKKIDRAKIAKMYQGCLG